jgi:hypothetical protein
MNSFKKIIIYLSLILIFGVSSYVAIVRYYSISDGIRSGELIKISHKGFLFKTWEGELSQGLSGAQIFSFSVIDENVVEKLKQYQGQYVKIEYKEHLDTFFWLGDTNYYISDVVPEISPNLKTKFVK